PCVHGRRGNVIMRTAHLRFAGSALLIGAAGLGACTQQKTGSGDGGTCAASSCAGGEPGAGGGIGLAGASSDGGVSRGGGPSSGAGGAGGGTTAASGGAAGSAADASSGGAATDSGASSGETVGTGDVGAPALGPPPSDAAKIGGSSFVLVKNW